MGCVMVQGGNPLGMGYTRIPKSQNKLKTLKQQPEIKKYRIVYTLNRKPYNFVTKAKSPLDARLKLHTHISMLNESFLAHFSIVSVDEVNDQ